MNKRKITTITLSSRMLLVLIVVAASFLAAFLGQIVISNLNNDPSLSSDERFVIRQPENTLEKLQKAHAEIVRKEQGGLVQFYNMQKGELVYLSSGVVLTNDGWLLSVETESEPTVVRLSSGELIKIEKILNDPSSQLIFIKVESSTLAPVTLATFFDPQPLQQYLIANYRNTIMTSSVVSSVIDSNKYLNSDFNNDYVFVTQGDIGNVIYNDSSEVVGVIVEENEDGSLLLHIDHIRDALDMVLDEENISRQSLAVQYIDLAQTPVSLQIANEQISGALVTSNNYYPLANAVLSESSETSKLWVNDIIVSVEGDLLNTTNTLSSLLIKFDIGEEIELGLIRNGRELTITVTLGSVASEL